MTKDEALRMAIEVFDIYVYGNKMNSAFADKAYRACKEALAETQEPVAYQPTSQEQSVMHQAMIRSSKLVHKATPPSREWVGLSDEEVQEVFNLGHKNFKEFARLIEMHLKAKNG